MKNHWIELEKIDLSAGLYIIASPIGHLKDITLRSLEVLNAVDFVASEDTRTYKKLVKYWQLDEKKSFAYHQHNEASSTKGLLDLIHKGHSIALLSDAGSINISDPGSNIVKACYEQNLNLTSLPGPSALTTAMSLSPIHKAFYFHGFAEKKKEARKKQLQATGGDSLHVFFESCHRINDHLAQANEIFPDRQLLLCKDLSKEPFEQILYSSVQDLCKDFSFSDDKGEYVLIYMPHDAENVSTENIQKVLQLLLDLKISSKDIIYIIKTLSHWDRNQIYKAIEKAKA